MNKIFCLSSLRIEIVATKSDESLYIFFFSLPHIFSRFFCSPCRRNKSFRARETVHVPWIALFALRANGKSTDKVSRYSEIFFTIDTNGDSEAAWKQKSPLN